LRNERELIRSRTGEGRARAKARGVVFGHKAEQKALRKNLERLRAERLAREKAKSKDT